MKKILYHPLVITAVTILVMIIIFSLRHNLKRLSLSQENLRSAQIVYEKQKQETAKQEAMLENMQQPLAKEKLVRNELLKQKEGEVLIKLPDITIERQESEKKQEKTIFEQWLEVLAL